MLTSRLNLRSGKRCARATTRCVHIAAKACPYWQLSEAYFAVYGQSIVDNTASVFWGVFMALWASVFIELWKRREQALLYKWNSEYCSCVLLTYRKRHDIVNYVYRVHVLVLYEYNLTVFWVLVSTDEYEVEPPRAEFTALTKKLTK